MIEGLDVPVILQYFNTLNGGDFAATSQLFAGDGVLQPPFDEGVVGATAIAAYLEREAKGFILQPLQGVETQSENGCTEYEILGNVQTSMFSVNVCWRFMLNSASQIELVKVKLLASLQELLHLRQ